MYKSPTYVIADWNIVNNKEYIKYKNKVNIISANYYSVVVDLEEDAPMENLIKSDQKWDDLVPSGTKAILENLDSKNRLQIL